MSNLPPNSFNNIPGQPQMNSNSSSQMPLHPQQFGQVPLNQLPPGYGGLKQDANFNNSNYPTPLPPTSAVQNNFNQSASSSPAFNQPGIRPPPQQGLQSSPIRPPLRPTVASNSNPVAQFSSINPNNINTPSFPPNYNQQQKQINDTAPPLIPSSQYQPVLNGPIGQSSQPIPPTSISYPVSSSSFTPPPLAMKPPVNASYGGPLNTASHQGPPNLINSQLGSSLVAQPNIPFSNAPRNSPMMSGPAYNGPPLPQPVSGPPRPGPPVGINGPKSNLGPMLPPPTLGTQTSNMPVRPGVPISGPPFMPPASGMPVQSFPGPPNNVIGSNQPQSNVGNINNLNTISGPQSLPAGLQSPPFNIPPGPPTGPLSGPPKGNMQNRYPQMPQGNYVNHQQPVQQQPVQQQQNQYPQQYRAHQLAQQMGQLSVTKQGFDQLWGHQVVDLMQCRHILPEYPEDPPEIRLGQQFADSSNCSPEIFRCTINRIPETNSLLQKSRLPLGILIHPFKDLNHLPVIQCATIVRCRSCRTYINPFVYFVDSKRWKCNLCFRVNDLPEEFQYDPVSKSYGDPCRRPEIKSATIEFIAPGEYMLRPPQPAVYLFLLDVSQAARDSGYLQVVCDTLKNSLEQMPGDARTQLGVICYDAHVHYYLMGDHLARPKEMTVLDIDDVFLPSPESLLVNVGERRELLRELLTVLPQRFSAPGVPASALGAALQAAYKLMAPTGGRITVFQTCLPNVGPGALQPREDPNARSAKEVSHLNPATDFYKRLALDCSGAQVAVDLFLLNSQYADLATLSGMSKFSAGTVYHIPLFRSSRTLHVAKLSRAFTRYLTRKIGFEAVMRVRCTRGVAIHTFHGNFFVRSTDLLSLPNVSPDAGFGMQLTIEESLADLQQVCFQAALLYTSSKGERRIRVHTLALPIGSTLSEILHSADQQCIIGLLAKCAVDRCVSASMPEAREALSNVAVDVLSAARVALQPPAGALPAPRHLRLLPLLLHALLKRKAFRTGTSTRLDDRVADMCDMKCLPLPQLLRAVYPDLYPLHDLGDLHDPHDSQDPPDPEPSPDLPRLQLSAERINANGAYLLDDGDTLCVYVCRDVSPAFLSGALGVAAHAHLPEEARTLPTLPTRPNRALHAFIDHLNDDRPYPSDLLIIRDNSPSRTFFTDKLIEDRIESALSYYEFLQHVKSQVK